MLLSENLPPCPYPYPPNKKQSELEAGWGVRTPGPPPPPGQLRPCLGGAPPTSLNSIIPCSGVATIFGPRANNLFGPLAKGLRRLLLPGGPLAAGLPTANGKKSGHNKSPWMSFAREREKKFKLFFADLEKTTSEV